MYIARTLTLTSADTNYNVGTLLAAALGASLPQTNCDELLVQSEATADDVLIGDATLSGSNYGYKLTPGQSRTYRTKGMQVGWFNLRSPEAGATVNVEMLST